MVDRWSMLRGLAPASASKLAQRWAKEGRLAGTVKVATADLEATRHADIILAAQLAEALRRRADRAL